MITVEEIVDEIRAFTLQRPKPGILPVEFVQHHIEELLMRLQLWAETIGGDIGNGVIERKIPILFDVAHAVVGKTIDRFWLAHKIFDGLNINTIRTSYDYMLLSNYVNWRVNEEEIRSIVKSDLPSPYEPYILLYKAGGVKLEYGYGRVSFHGYSIRSFRDYHGVKQKV